jgi:hypothetical protein
MQCTVPRIGMGIISTITSQIKVPNPPFPEKSANMTETTGSQFKPLPRFPVELTNKQAPNTAMNRLVRSKELIITRKEKKVVNMYSTIPSISG